MLSIKIESDRPIQSLDIKSEIIDAVSRHLESHWNELVSIQVDEDGYYNVLIEM